MNAGLLLVTQRGLLHLLPQLHVSPLERVKVISFKYTRLSAYLGFLEPYILISVSSLYLCVGNTGKSFRVVETAQRPFCYSSPSELDRGMEISSNGVCGPSADYTFFTWLSVESRAPSARYPFRHTPGIAKGSFGHNAFEVMPLGSPEIVDRVLLHKLLSACRQL